MVKTIVDSNFSYLSKNVLKNSRNAIINGYPSVCMHHDIVLNCIVIYELFCKTFAHFNAKDGWQHSFNEGYLKIIGFLLSVRCV